MKNFKECTPQEFWEQHQSANQKNLIDVRTKEEYDEGHAEGAVHLPLDSFDSQQVKALGLGEHDPVFLICRSGARSATACDYLFKDGYDNLTNIKGGTMAWKNAGLPIQT